MVLLSEEKAREPSLVSSISSLTESPSAAHSDPRVHVAPPICTRQGEREEGLHSGSRDSKDEVSEEESMRSSVGREAKTQGIFVCREQDLSTTLEGDVKEKGVYSTEHGGIYTTEEEKDAGDGGLRQQAELNEDGSIDVCYSITFWEYCRFLMGQVRERNLVGEESIEDAWSIATKRRGVYNLMQVPVRLERLLLLGCCACADEFLFLLTFLPLRCLLSLLSFPKVVLGRLVKGKPVKEESAREHRMQRNVVTTVIDFMQLSILIFASLVLHTFDISWIYHNIRGQSVIKLYVVFNVMEILDRLCCSFGVDILDSLGWTTTSAVKYWRRERNKKRPREEKDQSLRALRGFVLATRVLLDYFFTLLYTTFHAVLLLTWVVTLNVAINTQNNALITLLVSNNFIELKSSVFKNFKVQNLFQISCADAVERFQLTVFLSVMMAYTSGSRRLLAVWTVIFCFEVVVDWVKHAFVTKFNRIHHIAYQQFSLVICGDIVQNRASSVMRNIGGSTVSKRVGFISLPLGALVTRMVSGTLMRSSAGVSIMLFLIMCTLKVTLGILLIGHASRKVKRFARGERDWTLEENERAQDNWYETLAKVGRYDYVSKY